MKKFNILLLLFVAYQVNANTCYESIIQSPSPFMGNNDEVFKLADGSIWEVKYEYEYLYEYYPKVVICPGQNKLFIKDKSLNVHPLSTHQAPSNTNATGTVIESRIEGEFEGWDGETIFKLDNGQIWQQSQYAYTYTYKYRPNVTIFKNGNHYEMQVEGVQSRIKVERLK